MPVFIGEVVVELQDSVTESTENQSTEQQIPLTTAEIELAHSLALIKQRQDRLRID
ncbi:MAG: hypothetical protein KDF59_08420 [Nitrosomonas sp.]|nr:hypothetical protein [Nitrosomonas sp.]